MNKTIAIVMISVPSVALLAAITAGLILDTKSMLFALGVTGIVMILAISFAFGMLHLIEGENK